MLAGEQKEEAVSRKNVNEDVQLITKSFEDLLEEIAIIKREAVGRLSSLRNKASGASEPDRIRQTKVSRFVLRRVAELESESMKMRDELAKLFEFNKPTPSGSSRQRRQEDHDFDEASPSTQQASSPTGMPATSTMKPEEEAAKIGFDVEALKKLGEEIGKRLDQIGKEAAKNLAELVEGVKLVFREPNKKDPKRESLTNATSTVAVNPSRLVY